MRQLIKSMALAMVLVAAACGDQVESGSTGSPDPVDPLGGAPAPYDPCHGDCMAHPGCCAVGSECQDAGLGAECVVVGCQSAEDCDDDDACNGVETCETGTCVAGTPPVCPDDNNPCTVEACDSVAGCGSSPVANNTPCPNSTVCDGDETCQSGVCSAGTPLSCFDLKPCTTDDCNPLTGCTFVDTCEFGYTCTTQGCFETGSELCSDGIDNDMNGLTDCEDMDICGDWDTAGVLRVFSTGGQSSARTDDGYQMDVYLPMPKIDQITGEEIPQQWEWTTLCLDVDEGPLRVVVVGGDVACAQTCQIGAQCWRGQCHGTCTQTCGVDDEGQTQFCLFVAGAPACVSPTPTEAWDEDGNTFTLCVPYAGLITGQMCVSPLETDDFSDPASLRLLLEWRPAYYSE